MAIKQTILPSTLKFSILIQQHMSPQTIVTTTGKISPAHLVIPSSTNKPILPLIIMIWEHLELLMLSWKLIKQSLKILVEDTTLSVEIIYAQSSINPSNTSSFTLKQL